MKKNELQITFSRMLKKNNFIIFLKFNSVKKLYLFKK